MSDITVRINARDKVTVTPVDTGTTVVRIKATGPQGPANAIGSGDMTKVVYDPTTVEGDAFDMDNMAEGTTAKILTAAERTILSNTSGTNTGDQSAGEFQHDALSGISGTTVNEYNHPDNAEMIVLGNTSGTNTGDQVASDFNHDDLSAITGTAGQYNHPTNAQVTAITHDNRSNLDTINQNMATTDAVAFDTVTTDLIQFDLTAGETVTQGQMAWNADEETLDLGLNGATLQLGQELHYHVRNASGVDIADGTPVMVTGTLGASSRLLVDLMDASDHDNEKLFLGITTETIPNGTDGKVSSFGKIRHINTTGTLSFGGLETWNDGDLLYPDPAHVGYLTNVRPSPPDMVLETAIVLYAHSNGSLIVRTSNYDLNHYTPIDLHTNTLDPTGWVDNTAITMSYDSTTRTVTLTGDLRYYWNGVLHELTSPWTSDPHDATTDVTYFLFSTDGQTFTWGTSVWEFYQLMVAFAWYGASDKYGVREIHGTMPWQTHREFHARQGTYKVSGGTMSGYTLESTTAAERRPTIAATVVNDEDIYSTMPEWNVDTLGATQFYLSGATPVSVFTTGATDIIPLSGSRPYYNLNTAGTWSQALMSNNAYTTAWLVGVPTTGDAASQTYRYWWVQGQSEGSLSEMQALSPLDLSVTGIPTITPEFTFLAKVIIQYTAANWRLSQVDILSGSRAQITSGASGNYLSIVSSDTTLTGTGTSGDPLSVVNDGHTHATQYAPVLGADDNYVTDAEKIVIGNTSGTNTGDQTIDDITPTTTKGDLIVENGTNAVRLPVGTNDYVLTADSAEATGIKWAASAGGGGGLTWARQATSTTAVADNGYLVDASGGNITITLPASPTEGDTVGVCDAENQATTNVITIAGNSENIESSATDLIMDIDGSGITLVYYDATVGWKIVSEVTALSTPAKAGATLPTSPSQGDLFLHTPTGRSVLMEYVGSTWYPVATYGTMDVYVDGGSGTDGPEYGTATGASAFATIQYAVDMIPTTYGGQVTINVAAGTYVENVVIANKVASGLFDIKLEGALSLQESISGATCTRGSSGTHGSITKTGAFTGDSYANMLVYLVTDDTYRVIDSHTNDTLTIAGNIPSATTQDIVIYDYAARIVPSSSTPLTVQTTTATVMFMSIETDRARCVINASTTYYGCKFTNGLYTSLAVAYMGWCYVGSSYNYGVDCINNGQITLHWCKLLFTTNAIRIMIHSRLNCRGTVVRGPSGSTGLNLWVNSACDFWSNDDYGKTFVQNWSTGVSLLTGTMTSNAGGFITYSSCSTNYTAAASSYAYYG